MEFTFKTMLETAKEKGVTSDKIMWQSIDDVDCLLSMVKSVNKKTYFDFMRKIYGRIYQNHYATKDFAEWDIEQMRSIDKDGKEIHGAYWTCEQVIDKFKSMDFALSSDFTKYDLWVMANAAKHDWGKKFDDDKVFELAYLFYVDDEDYPSHDKIFSYISMIKSKENDKD